MSNLPTALVARIRGLQQRSVRERARRFVAEGPRVVEDALAGRMRVREVVHVARLRPLVQSFGLRGLLDGVLTHETDAATFATLVESVQPQGILAVVEMHADALVTLSRDRPLLLLDGLQDPGNAGTLLRSLRATGGGGVLALKGTVELYNPKVVRASAGSLMHLQIVRDLTATAALDWLATHRLPLVALEAEGRSLYDVALAGVSVIAIGNEAAGLSAEVRAAAAARVSLPMEGGTESLNAAVAGSVALYELYRRRSAECSVLSSD